MLINNKKEDDDECESGSTQIYGPGTSPRLLGTKTYLSTHDDNIVTVEFWNRINFYYHFLPNAFNNIAEALKLI